MAGYLEQESSNRVHLYCWLLSDIVSFKYLDMFCQYLIFCKLLKASGVTPLLIVLLNRVCLLLSWCVCVSVCLRVDFFPFEHKSSFTFNKMTD